MSVPYEPGSLIICARWWQRSVYTSPSWKGAELCCRLKHPELGLVVAIVMPWAMVVMGTRAGWIVARAVHGDELVGDVG